MTQQRSPNAASEIVQHAKDCPTCGPILAEALAEVRDRMRRCRRLLGPSISEQVADYGRVLDG